jgi:hypothetical protein
MIFQECRSDKETRCMPGTIRALPLVPATISNPEIMADGEKISFITEMKPGMYPEFNSRDDCRLCESKGEFIRDVEIEGSIPVMKAGENEIAFSCRGPSGINPRLQVTVITMSDRLLK